MWRPLRGQETRDRIAVSSAGRPGGQRGWGFQAMTDQGRYVHACHGRTRATRRHLQLTLPASGLPVRLARQVTREVLTAWQLAHVEETAVLLVSELVTNAVRHATCTDAITLELEVVQT
jgi:hypothetical protein